MDFKVLKSCYHAFSFLFVLIVMQLQVLAPSLKKFGWTTKEIKVVVHLKFFRPGFTYLQFKLPGVIVIVTAPILTVDFIFICK